MPSLQAGPEGQEVGFKHEYFLKQGCPLARVYETASQYAPLSWNSRVHGVEETDVTVGGRFDSTPHFSGPNTGSLYAASAQQGFKTAIAETFANKAEFNSDLKCSRIPEDFFVSRSVRTFVASADLRLVDLVSEDGRDSVGIPHEVCTSPDRRVTRLWGEWIRKDLDVGGFHGFAYNSVKRGNGSSDPSIVLFEEVCMNIDFVATNEVVDFSYSSGGREGRKVLSQMKMWVR